VEQFGAAVGHGELLPELVNLNARLKQWHELDDGLFETQLAEARALLCSLIENFAELLWESVCVVEMLLGCWKNLCSSPRFLIFYFFFGSLQRNLSPLPHRPEA
jgi:hypothetical protein